jgi:predicted PurR-regulated permease PerM
MAKRNNSINKTLAMTLVFSGGVLILLAFVLMRVENIIEWIGTFLGILRPVIIGIILTFVLYGPTVKITHLLEKATKGRKFPCTGVAVLITFILFFGIVTGLIWIVVPSFISSIEEFTMKFSGYVINIQKWMDNFVTEFNGKSGMNIVEQLSLNAEEILDQITNVVSMIPNYMPDLMEKVGEWASGIAGVLTDIIFGIVFSVYILVGRAKLKRQAKRIIKTFFSQTTYQRIAHMSHLSFSTFSNFVSGQLMEALILGLLCFIGMTILDFDYAIMISVIVGVTNIIPIIGPIIGTVPGAVIYLLIDPWRAVWFVVFVIVLQQIDSNLIYPRVVGNSVGLPAIWILFAVTVGGGLFGVMGMVIGVPLMSIIYTILREKTAPAAEAVEEDNRPPMFPGVGEKTTEIVSKMRTSMQSGFGNMMDKINDRIRRKASEKDDDDDDDDDEEEIFSHDEASESENIDKALEEFERRTKTETE